jgi:hypothetical protein
MQTVRITANILFYITKIAALLLLLTTVYAFIILLLSLHTDTSGLPIEVQGDGHFIIFYPFTETPFLAGDHTSSYLITSTVTVFLYGLFLWLLSDVFRAFKQDRLFTAKGVLRLKRFYLFNIAFPIIYLVILAILSYEIRDATIIVFLHLMIGVFAFFMAAIFKQGLLLQEEQDLTL